MKRLLTLAFLINILLSATAQDSSRLSISFEPLIAVMSNQYNFNPITEELPAHYTYNSPIGFGAALSLNHVPTRIGVNLMYQHYTSVEIGERHTGNNLSPFSTQSIDTKQGETRLSLAPYYDWSKSRRFKLATGLILTHVRNRLDISDLMRKDGKQIDAEQYKNGYAGSSKTAYGLYASFGINFHKVNANLFTSYELTDTRYYANAETKARKSLICGFSIGYLLVKK